MKPAKTFVLAALIASTAMASTGASSATAEPTALCGSDEVTCKSPITHIHEATKVKAKLKSFLNVECDVLFLGDVGSLGSPQVITGKFTYTNCGSCTVEEQNGPAEIKALRAGSETAYAEIEWLIHVVCKGFIDCYYDGVGLEPVFSGALVALIANGTVATLGQELQVEYPGFLCPEKTELYIVTVPLSATYISQ